MRILPAHTVGVLGCNQSLRRRRLRKSRLLPGRRKVPARSRADRRALRSVGGEILNCAGAPQFALDLPRTNLGRNFLKKSLIRPLTRHYKLQYKYVDLTYDARRKNPLPARSRRLVARTGPSTSRR